MPTTFPAVLTGIKTMSASTALFTFSVEGDRAVTLQPGQFFRFTFRDEEGEFERSYSLCNLDVSTPLTELELVISEVEGGRATRLLFAAKPGLTARVEGPFGRLLIPEPAPERLVMVATSVGIAPYLPMLAPLAAQNVSVEFLFGVRDRTEFLFSDLLVEHARRDNFNLRLCLSREAALAATGYEYDGYVNAQVTLLHPEPERDHFLLCGNPQMIDDVYPVLKNLGFRPRRVTREKYVFAKSVSKNKPVLSDAQKKLIAEKLKLAGGSKD